MCHLFKAIQQKTPGQRRLIRGEDPKAVRVKVEQPDGHSDLDSATYGLRVRRELISFQ